MEIEFLTDLLCKFRDALEFVSNNRLYGRLNIFEYFPNGCCCYTSDLLATFLVDSGVSKERIQIVDGQTKKFDYTHCWLVIDEVLCIDITADQFNGKLYFKKYEPIPKCVITQINTYFYELFDITKTQFRKNVGVDTYSADISLKLKIVYDETIKQLNNGL